MGVHPKIDRAALHEYLWFLADSKGRLRINQLHLAQELGCERMTIFRIFREFQDRGILRKIKEGSRRVVMFEVSQPPEKK